MTFTQKFDDYVCIGDAITCTMDGYTVTARIAQDETPDAPDERQDGFWPSLYKDDAGFIDAGNGWRDRFDTAQARAEKIMAAWKNDEWFYCGVILQMSCYPKRLRQRKRNANGNVPFSVKPRQ